MQNQSNQEPTSIKCFSKSQDLQVASKTQTTIKKCKKICKNSMGLIPSKVLGRKGPKLQVIEKNRKEKKYVGRPKGLFGFFQAKEQAGNNYLINFMIKQAANKIRNDHFIQFFYLINKKNGLVFTPAERQKLNRKKSRKINWDQKAQYNKKIQLQKISKQLKKMTNQKNNFFFQQLPFYEELKQGLLFIFQYVSQIFCQETTKQLYKILRKIFQICWLNHNNQETLISELNSYGHKIGTNHQQKYKFISFRFSNIQQFRLNAYTNQKQAHHHIWLVQKIAKQFCDLVCYFNGQNNLSKSKKQKQVQESRKDKQLNNYISLSNAEDYAGRFLQQEGSFEDNQYNQNYKLDNDLNLEAYIEQMQINMQDDQHRIQEGQRRIQEGQCESQKGQIQNFNMNEEDQQNRSEYSNIYYYNIANSDDDQNNGDDDDDDDLIGQNKPGV